MVADTIFAQTGWKRRGNFALCQELDVLERIYDHDFDLNDEGFRNELETRGVLSFKKLENLSLEQHIDILQNWSEHRVLTDDILAYSITGLKFDEAHKKTSLRIWKITRGKIQDCWEIYNNPETQEMIRKEAEEKYNNGDVF